MAATPNLPEHKSTCKYERNDQDLWTDCTCGVTFNFKSFLHWQQQARELVVGCLLSAADVNTRSIIGHLAYKRIMGIAQSENPEMVQEITEKRHQIHENITQVLLTS